ALVDEFAKGFINVLPSTIACGLSSSTSCEVIGTFVAREAEFLGVDDDAAALVDEFANGLTNMLPSTIAFGLSSSTSCEEIGIFVSREDEFVRLGTVSAIDVDAVDV
nr:hypothetical protein [Tanacetum cinerariifolium]